MGFDRRSALVRRFDEAFRANPAIRRYQPPTDASLSTICERLDVPALPETLVRLAHDAVAFQSWFSGLGPDFDASTHILRYNEYWRSEGLPERYVVFTHGFDAVCDCLDREGADDSNDAESMRVVQVQVDGDDTQEGQVVAPSFDAYLEWLIEIFGIASY